MKMKTMAVWLAGATLCAAGHAAQAQATEPVQKPTTIKLGVFLPQNGDLKNVSARPGSAPGPTMRSTSRGRPRA